MSEESAVPNIYRHSVNTFQHELDSTFKSDFLNKEWHFPTGLHFQYLKTWSSMWLSVLLVPANTKSIFCSSKECWNMTPSLHNKLDFLYVFWSPAAWDTQQQRRETWWLQFEPQSTPPVPHSAVAEGTDEPAGRCGPGDARERPGVDADARHLFLQRGQVAVVYKAENIQEAQHGERLA